MFRKPEKRTEKFSQNTPQKRVLISQIGNKSIFILFMALCIVLISRGSTEGALASHIGNSVNSYTYQVTPSGFTCGNVNPGAGIVKARAIPDNTNRLLTIQLEKCDNSNFSLPSDVYIGVNNPIDFTFHDSPTGYVCGNDGNMELNFTTSETNPRFRARKCAGGSLVSWGQAQMYVDGNPVGNRINYDAGDSSVTIYFNPLEEEFPGVRSYKMALFPEGRPNDPLFTGEVDVWETYNLDTYAFGPFDAPANQRTFSTTIDPSAFGNLETFTLYISSFPNGSNGQTGLYPHRAGTIEVQATQVADEPNLQVDDAAIETTGPYFAGSSIGIEAHVKNVGTTSANGSQLGYYIASTSNGSPIEVGEVRTNSASSINVNGRTDTLYEDVYIPRNLSSGTYYAVFHADYGNDVSEGNESDNKYSIPFTIQSCDTSNLYCDVPDDNVFQEVIEAIKDNLTNGCRSDNNFGSNAVFCPEMLVDRGSLSVFMVRRQLGYTPSLGSYQGYFADVPASHPQALWIEKAKDLGIVNGCGTNNQGQAIFCPDYDTSGVNGLVTRANIAIFLATTEDWELQPITGIFEDVTGNGFWEQAVEYMYNNGYTNGAGTCQRSSTPAGLHYCPEDFVQRQHMAAFTARAFNYIVGNKTSTFIGQGFDKCEIPSLSEMQAWFTDSPYKVVNLYIGGSRRACGNQALTSFYVSQLSQQGWKFIPTWVGPQCLYGDINNNPTIARQQGIDEANKAIVAAASLSLTMPNMSGTVIYYDMESYNSQNPNCRESAKAFIDGWTAQLHTKGNLSGVYGSSCAANIADFFDIDHVPDAVWPASWYWPAGQGQYSSEASVWDVSCLDNSLWNNHQRIRQYAGEINETWGGVTLNIDSNVIDGIVADLEQGSSSDCVSLNYGSNNNTWGSVSLEETANSIKCPTDNTKWQQGSEVILKASTNIGYEFVSWTGVSCDVPNCESLNRIVIGLDYDRNLTANFEIESTTRTVLDVRYIDQVYVQEVQECFGSGEDKKCYWNHCGPASLAMFLHHQGVETRDVLYNRQATLDLVCDVKSGCRGGSINTKIRDIMIAKGLTGSHIEWTPTFDQIKQSIDNGYPVIFSITNADHILVITGYDTNNRIIVNDPYGDYAWWNYSYFADPNYRNTPASTEPKLLGEDVVYTYGSDIQEFYAIFAGGALEQQGSTYATINVQGGGSIVNDNVVATFSHLGSRLTEIASTLAITLTPKYIPSHDLSIDMVEVFDLTASDENGQLLQESTQPYNISIDINPDLLENWRRTSGQTSTTDEVENQPNYEAQFVLLAWDNDVQKWIEIPFELDESNGRMNASSDQFTEFVVGIRGYVSVYLPLVTR